MADTDRIKRNLGKMIDQGAPEGDIDAYLKTEGFNSPDEWRAAIAPQGQATPGSVSRIVGQGAQGFNDAVANTAGLPGDIISWVENKLTKGLGLPGRPKAAGTPLLSSEGLKEAADYVATLPGRVGDAVSQGSLAPLTDSRTSRFEPQGTAEKVAHGVGSGVGNALSIAIPAGVVANTAKAGTLTQGVANTLAAAPGIQAVAGGVQGGVTEGTGNPWLGTAAGIAVPVGIAAAKRLVTPFPETLTPQEKAITTTAQNADIPLTPAQATGNRNLRIVEEKMAKLPGSAGPVGQMFNEQHGAFNSAVLKKAGIDAADASPATLDKAFTQAGQTFDDLASRTKLNVDNQFVNDVNAVVQKYGRRLETNVAPVFKSYLDDLTPLMQAVQSGQNPQVVGDIYKTVRSDIGGTIRANWKNPDLQKALGGLQKALDDVVERSTSGSLKQEWQDARRQYQALMTIDQAVRGGTQATRSAGDIPYSGLTSAVRNADRAGFARGRGQLNALSRVGDYIAQRTPDSGTPAGEAILNPLKWPMLAGLNVAGHLYTSAPVRNFLTNQLAASPSNVRELLAAQAARELMNRNENALARGGR